MTSPAYYPGINKPIYTTASDPDKPAMDCPPGCPTVCDCPDDFEVHSANAFIDRTYTDLTRTDCGWLDVATSNCYIECLEFAEEDDAWAFDAAGNPVQLIGPYWVLVDADMPGQTFYAEAGACPPSGPAGTPAIFPDDWPYVSNDPTGFFGTPTLEVTEL